MKVFIVFAHPESQSLNGTLLDILRTELEGQGHEVKVSDLYRMKWKAQVDSADFPLYNPEEKLELATASKEATVTGTLTEDVKAEQEKLLWADLVILQFPLWWFGLPAILKGWVDRTYSRGFAYGVHDPNRKDKIIRYGEGTFQGKRAMLFVTTGSREAMYSKRGVHGYIDDILFPINHGILFYSGFSTILQPMVFFGINGITDEKYKKFVDDLGEFVRNLETRKSIKYRTQNGGDYDDGFQLKPGREATYQTGLDIHIKRD